MEIAQRGIERKRSTACGEILDNKANGSLVPINIVTHAHQLPKEFLEPFAKNYLLLDLPGIIKVVKDGKGRGRQVSDLDEIKYNFDFKLDLELPWWSKHVTMNVENVVAAAMVDGGGGRRDA
ncbi:hypothetical protein LguiB_035428 [Lonicera macranthoides]